MRLLSCIIALKMWKGDPLRFFNINSVSKYQKIEGGPFETLEKVSRSRKREEVSVPKKWKRRFHVRGFGCARNQVLSTHGKSAQWTKSGLIALNWQKTSHSKSHASSSIVLKVYEIISKGETSIISLRQKWKQGFDEPLIIQCKIGSFYDENTG